MSSYSLRPAKNTISSFLKLSALYEVVEDPSGRDRWPSGCGHVSQEMTSPVSTSYLRYFGPGVAAPDGTCLFVPSGNHELTPSCVYLYSYSSLCIVLPAGCIYIRFQDSCPMLSSVFFLRYTPIN